MFKKKLVNLMTIIILLFLISNIIYALNDENATDIIIEYEGFCPNYPVEFILYNQTQHLDKEDIEEDLCAEDETPEDDRCEEWERFKGTVTVYNGPIDGTGILKEFNLDDQREFQITFPVSNDYLVEFESDEPKIYKSWKKTVSLLECKYSDNNEDNSINENLNENEIIADKTFLYDDNKVVINLIETTYNSQEQITYIEIENTQLNNSIKSFEISNSNNKDNNNKNIFKTIKIQMDIEIEDKEIEFYKLNKDTTSWEKIEIQNIELRQNSITFEIQTFGEYTIASVNSVVTIENDNQNEIIQENKGEDIDSENKKSQPISLDLNKVKTTQFSPVLIGGVIVFILVILGFLVIPKKNEKIDMSEYQTESIVPINSEIYEKTKQYVQKYKLQYNQEQISQSLTAAKIDTAVIEKVLKEEFIQL